MAPEIASEVKKLGWQVKAQYYPQVPGWLMANLPDKAVLLPNGEVLGINKLEAEEDTSGDDPCCGASGYEYTRFSVDGEPLGSTTGDWFGLFYDASNGCPGVPKHARSDGYFIFEGP